MTRWLPLHKSVKSAQVTYDPPRTNAKQRPQGRRKDGCQPGLCHPPWGSLRKLCFPHQDTGKYLPLSSLSLNSISNHKSLVAGKRPWPQKHRSVRRRKPRACQDELLIVTNLSIPTTLRNTIRISQILNVNSPKQKAQGPSSNDRYWKSQGIRLNTLKLYWHVCVTRWYWLLRNTTPLTFLCISA